MRKQTFFILTLSIILLTLTPTSFARTFTVDNDGPANFSNIRFAINAAHNDDTVLVKDGIYTGPLNQNIDFLGKAITVKSENGPNDCIIDCQQQGRSFCFHSRENNNCVLDGFTIKNGYVDNTHGGGIYCINSSPKITNCIIKNNIAYSSMTGKMAFGGGMYVIGTSNPLVQNCVFIENESAWGGGMCTNNSRAKLVNCVFEGNSAGMGGAIFNIASSNLTLTSCILSDNNAETGGGIWNHNSNLNMRNCTLSGNEAYRNGGGIYNEDSSAILTSCILWNNHSNRTGNEIYTEDSSLEVTYCDVKGGWAGTGNINIAPCFVDSGYGDYHLLENSPCIDTGDPNYIPEPNETDLDGNPRVLDSRIDMGAYEFNYSLIRDPEESMYLACTGYEVVWQRRLSRSEFEYCLRMKIKNLGNSDLEDITVELKYVSANTTILNNKVFFSAIPVGGEVLSEDTFIVKVDRSVAAYENDIIWEISDQAESDFSGDGQVNFVDLDYLADKWLQTGAGMAEDLYQDEIINFIDFAIFAEKWLRD